MAKKDYRANQRYWGLIRKVWSFENVTYSTIQYVLHVLRIEPIVSIIWVKELPHITEV